MKHRSKILQRKPPTSTSHARERGGGMLLLGHTLIGAPVSRGCAASAEWLSCTRDTFPAHWLVSRIIGRDSSESMAAGVLLSGSDKSEIRDLLSRGVK